MAEDFEKLGVFYLGKVSSPTVQGSQRSFLLYESKDLLTHGLCVGMTGSGKTGLCLGVIEEAVIDGIPVIAIDPKGDLGNLLLAFPDLREEDFLPWVGSEEAKRLGISVQALACRQATLWKEGLLAWDEDGNRIRKYKESADFAIYTPGGTHGLPVSILASLARPTSPIEDDPDLMRERVTNVVNCFLTLLGISADPLKSKEHILLSTLIDRAWRAGKNVDLQQLIEEIQVPPIKRIGALDLETFFPEKERFTLALSLNNLLAAPGFRSWLNGEPLNIDSLLFGKQGKPRVSIFSIAHLNDAERMFFVTLLLNQVIAWMRSQPGSSSLRAILYMDEIYGYFPPVANPPSKTPLLTLLKQARAYGLGVLLASQNSVDLDYKGLANAGTWFIGRLQTERDKQRLLDGLEGAAAETGKEIDRQQIDTLLGRLKSRQFLINNVHADRPELFESRWTLSYLFGPLARSQIKLLMSERETAADNGEEQLAGVRSTSAANCAPNIKTIIGSSIDPTVDPTIVSAPNADRLISPPFLAGATAQHFVPPARRIQANQTIVYQAVIFASASIRFIDAKAKLDTTIQKSFLLPIADSLKAIAWDDSTVIHLSIDELANAPLSDATFAVPPPTMAKEKNRDEWRRQFKYWLASNEKLYLLKSVVNNQFSQPREAEREFRIRLTQAASENRAAAVQKLREKYAPKIAKLEERIRAARNMSEEAETAYRQHQVGAAIDIGATVLGSFFGRKPASNASLNKASAAAKEIAKAVGKSKDIERRNETWQRLTQELLELDNEFKSEMNQLASKFNSLNEQFEPVSFAAKPSNILIALFTPVWAPACAAESGELLPIWR